MKLTLLASLVLLLSAASVRSADAEKRVLVDQAFLESNPDKFKITAFEAEGQMTCFLTCEAELFGGHMKTWAHIRDRDGAMLASLPLEFGKTRDPSFMVLIWRYAVPQAASCSELEMTFRVGDSTTVYVLPFGGIVPQKKFEE